jgi:uncharacterized protein (DUF488 family)
MGKRFTFNFIYTKSSTNRYLKKIIKFTNMKIISKNTEILTSSLKFNNDNTEVTFQANTNLSVEGNPYEDLFTTKTVFNLVCETSKISNILEIAQLQINLWVEANYPTT